MARRTYYQILGVPRNATSEVVKRAFRDKARTLHPDQRPDDPASAEEFKAVAEAYAVLSDPELRRSYDLFGIAPPGAAFERTELAAPSFGSALKTVARVAASRLRSRRGDDIVLSVNLSLRAAVLGTRRVFELPRASPDGRVAPRRLEFTLPPGLEDSRVLRWPGEGTPGRDGGRPGDLLVTVSVERHPYFLRRERDIVGTLPLAFPELLDGASVKVPTVRGPRQLVVPPRTQPGSELRLSGLGVPGDPPGDAVYVAQLRFPSDTNGAADATPGDATKGTARDAIFDACLLESLAWRDA